MIDNFRSHTCIRQLSLFGRIIGFEQEVISIVYVTVLPSFGAHGTNFQDSVSSTFNTVNHSSSPMKNP